MGLDIAKLQKDAQGAEVKAALAENVGLGDKLGLSGTPAFIIGEEIIPGAVGVEPIPQDHQRYPPMRPRELLRCIMPGDCPGNAPVASGGDRLGPPPRLIGTVGASNAMS